MWERTQDFGGLAYEIGVVEFQKRGLPHAHIAVKFKTEPPLSVLDSFILAELQEKRFPVEYYNDGQEQEFLSDA